MEEIVEVVTDIVEIGAEAAVSSNPKRGCGTLIVIFLIIAIGVIIYTRYE